MPLPRLFGPIALALAVFMLADAASARPPAKLRTHTVYSGQRLGSIAKRYNVTIEAICTANGISRRDPIKPGQRLVIPDRSDKDGTQARAAVLGTKAETGRSRSSKNNASRKQEPAWTTYRKRPARRGYVDIITHTRRWRGLVLDSKGRIRPVARKALGELFGATGQRPKLSEGLIRLLVKVSDTFGGRPLRVVSGYRTTSYFRDSRHKTSEAVDFSVVGVPNAAVRDYLLTLGRVGVGYYPNSTFLHLDVRKQHTYWVDYSGPGEAPRKHARGHAPESTDFDDHAERNAENENQPADPGSPGDAAGPTLPASVSPLGSVTQGETRPGSLPAQPSPAP